MAEHRYTYPTVIQLGAGGVSAHARRPVGTELRREPVSPPDTSSASQRTQVLAAGTGQR